ncbi:nucleotidyl transferase AbiEii/AbiGii toxin family protein [Candidatus Omnitrophota bacterium]
MDILKRHEAFEIEALEKLKNAGFLEPLVFGGGTMLRLCYEINRYSADLDFWFIKETDPETYFGKLKRFLANEYELTDTWIKFYTLLFEFRSGDYPKKLKIEIRKEERECDFQERIAFSRFGTKQVILRVHTLEQTMKNKIEAALKRREIKDFFDIEFLLRRGISMLAPPERLAKLKRLAQGFGINDYGVTLGSILDPEMRKYYTENGFSYLIDKISR